MTESGWFYFGCASNSGHYLFPEGQQRTLGRGRPLMEKLTLMDGKLAPFPERELYVAAVSRLGSIGYTAVSWWDRSVDRRPGSNSTVFAPSLTMPAEEIITEAKKRFPWVFARLPQEIVLP